MSGVEEFVCGALNERICKNQSNEGTFIFHVNTL
jgi:hypothetical protein